MHRLHVREEGCSTLRLWRDKPVVALSRHDGHHTVMLTIETLCKPLGIATGSSYPIILFLYINSPRTTATVFLNEK